MILVDFGAFWVILNDFGLILGDFGRIVGDFGYILSDFDSFGHGKDIVREVVRRL